GPLVTARERPGDALLGAPDSPRAGNGAAGRLAASVWRGNAVDRAHRAPRLATDASAVAARRRAAPPCPGGAGVGLEAASRDRWRVRWWMKLMDQWLGPSFSMIGWKVFVGPAVSSRDPAVLKAAIERIPLPERRIAWRKAIYGEFGAEELEESQRRVALGIR